MNTITLKLSALTSTTNSPFVTIQQPVSAPMIFIPIDGPLPEGRELAYPIMVKIEEEDREEREDREFIVSEPRYHIHGVGRTVLEAIASFKRIFSGQLDVLSEEEENLSSYMHEQLIYLRSVIRITQ